MKDRCLKPNIKFTLPGRTVRLVNETSDRIALAVIIYVLYDLATFEDAVKIVNDIENQVRKLDLFSLVFITGGQNPLTRACR